MKFKYKKVIVLGNNGSGKSFFSKNLAEITGLPLIHLDLLYWKENWTRPSREEWAEIQENLVKNERWIIDGMHVSTLEIRFREADAIFFLDIDLKTCLDAIKQREERKRSDFPSFLDKKEGNFDEFIKGAQEFEVKRKPKILELHRKYPTKDFIVFKSREEIDRYLKEISAKI